METRNVKVTLETAQRWYGQGGEFKEMALSAYTEAELNPVKNEWESRFVGKEITGHYVAQISEIREYDDRKACLSDMNVFKTEKQAKSALAYAQLTQLMALPEYNGDWVADWSAGNIKKSVIRMFSGELEINSAYELYFPICFKSDKIRNKFLENNRDLLKQYFEL